MIKKEKLNFYIKNNYNVLFVGKHGVGKTSIIKKAFNEAGLKWRYFSASTMDPWVDFVGIPKEQNDGEISYIDLIRPKDFAKDDVEALFFDEYNRSKEKIRNAVMELIQFKSINGKKFNNLKIVWAAINPPDEDEEEFGYDVEKIDPAQLDRFEIHVEIPYKPSLDFFSKKYGKVMSKSAISWWNDQSQDVKDLISPRRLDYVLDVYTKNGDISDVLGKKIANNELIRTLAEGPIKEKLEKLYKNNDQNEIISFFENENNYSSSIKLVSKKNEYLSRFLHLFPKEKISSLFTKDKKIQNFIFEKLNSQDIFVEILRDIEKSNLNKSLSNKIRKALNGTEYTDIDQYHTGLKSCKTFDTNGRRRKYEFIKSNLKLIYSSDKDGEVAYDSVLELLKIANRSQTSTMRKYFNDLQKICNDLINFSIKKKDKRIIKKIEGLKQMIDNVNKKHVLKISTQELLKA